MVIPIYHPSCLNELTFKGTRFSFLKLLTIFYEDFTSLLMVINSKKKNKNKNQSIQTIFGEIMSIYYE